MASCCPISNHIVLCYAGLCGAETVQVAPKWPATDCLLAQDAASLIGSAYHTAATQTPVASHWRNFSAMPSSLLSSWLIVQPSCLSDPTQVRLRLVQHSPSSVLYHPVLSAHPVRHPSSTVLSAHKVRHPSSTVLSAHPVRHPSSTVLGAHPVRHPSSTVLGAHLVPPPAAPAVVAALLAVARCCAHCLRGKVHEAARRGGEGRRQHR